MSIKVAIVEDNTGVRENWKKLIDGEPGFACVAACDTGEAALKRFPGLAPDVVLMDINLPGMSGIECTERLKERLPATQILIVTVYADNEHVFEALKRGASGYLLKCTDPAELLRSIGDVMRGGAPMTGQIARKVIGVFRKPAVTVASEAQLTRREEEVLELIAKGYANKEIALKLGTSVETVRVHLRHIYEKLHVHSRSQAAARHFSRGGGAHGDAPAKL